MERGYLEEDQVSNLEKGFDFRLPIYRREVFLRLYEFHLKYGTHPGLVYMLMPYLFKKFGWTQEQKYWFAFINGCTQNPCTSWVIFNHFPDYEKITETELENWHRKNWKNLFYDIDRRYVKGHFVENFINYRKNLGGLSQVDFFENKLCNTDNKYKNFYEVWDKVISDFFMFGRLSTYSYLEYLKIMGLNIDCPELFLEDLSGSKSHRNGLMILNGRDDLDWHKDNPKVVSHNKEVVDFAINQGQLLLKQAKMRFFTKPFYGDVNYFTLESTLCCFKSHFRVNRRYPNVYTDMLFERIKKAETTTWGNLNFDVFWEARQECLPKHLLLEFNKKDPTYIKGKLDQEKQNHFRLTGQIIMMDKEWSCFENDFNDKYYE